MVPPPKLQALTVHELQYAPKGVPKLGPLPPHGSVPPEPWATDSTRNLPYRMRSSKAKTSTNGPSTPGSVPCTSLIGLSNCQWGLPPAVDAL